MATPPTPDPENLVLKLTAREILDFIEKQSKNERDFFDRLLKWFVAAVTIAVAIVGGIGAFLGIQNSQQVKKYSQDLRDDAQQQIRIAVQKELTEPKIQEQIAKALQQKTEDQLQAAINKGVAVELDKPVRRTLINDAIKNEIVAKMAWRILTEPQSTTIAESLQYSPIGQVSVRAGALGEQEHYASLLSRAMRASPSWKDHVSHAAPGSWAGLTDAGDETLEFLGAKCGIAIVVNDVGHPLDSARQLEAALKLKGASIGNVVLSGCGCKNPPKPWDIWLYVLEKCY